MTSDQLKGKAKKVEGKVEEEVGKLTGNTTQQVKGKAKQTEGKIQEEVGKAKKKV